MRTLEKLQVIIENEEIKPITDISISQSYNWHHSFEVIVRSDALKNSFEKKLGKIIKINFAAKVGKEQFDNFFSGIITAVETSSDVIQGNIVIFRGQSPTYIMDCGRNCRSFSDMSLSQIANEVLNVYPKNYMDPQVKPGSDPKIPYVVQYRESDYHFLSRLAANFGEWFSFDGSKLYLGKIASDKETELIFRSNLAKANLEIKVAPTQFIQHAYNYLKHEYTKSPSSKANITGDSSYGKLALEQSEHVFKEMTCPTRNNVIEKKDLDDLTLHLKASRVNNMVILNGTSDIPDLKVGKIIKLKSLGESDGKYLIITISHRMDSNGNYENYFEAVPSDIVSPPLNVNLADPVAETQTAKVVDNKDPEGLGRIKVKFIWDQKPTPWLRVVSPHAGDNRGFYFIPEIDDEVIVGFEFSNPDRPYVVGTMYHGKTKPTDWQDQKNNIKAIRTKSGNEIYFFDAPGKEEIRILNKDSGNEISLSLSGEGKITIKSKGTLELSARNIKIEAQQSIECKASAEAKFEAANTSIKSSAKLEINGGALAEIKAGIIKLN